jgi:hypothetical protein
MVNYYCSTTVLLRSSARVGQTEDGKADRMYFNSPLKKSFHTYDFYYGFRGPISRHKEHHAIVTVARDKNTLGFTTGWISFYG